MEKIEGEKLVKVEEKKFKEVGYVGRDVEKIIRDMVEIEIKIVSEKRREEVKEKENIKEEERVMEEIVGKKERKVKSERLRKKMRNGEMEEKEIEIEV